MHENEHGLLLFGDAALTSRVPRVARNVVHDEELGRFALEGQFRVGLRLSLCLLLGKLGLSLLLFLRLGLKVIKSEWRVVIVVHNGARVLWLEFLNGTATTKWISTRRCCERV